MHVEHEAADRHGGISAVRDQVVPVFVAQLGHVEPERSQQILRVARRQPALGQCGPQAHRLGIIVAIAEQVRFQPVELRELLIDRERRVVRDVVGDTHEFVEGENDAAMARVDQP